MLVCTQFSDDLVHVLTHFSQFQSQISLGYVLVWSWLHLESKLKSSLIQWAVRKLNSLTSLLSLPLLPSAFTNCGPLHIPSRTLNFILKLLYILRFYSLELMCVMSNIATTWQFYQLQLECTCHSAAVEDFTFIQISN